MDEGKYRTSAPFQNSTTDYFGTALHRASLFLIAYADNDAERDFTLCITPIFLLDAAEQACRLFGCIIRLPAVI